MKRVCLLVLLGGAAHADAPKVDNVPKECGGDMHWQELPGLGAQVPVPDAGSLNRPSVLGEPAGIANESVLDIGDGDLVVDVYPARDDELDFKAAKAQVDKDDLSGR